MKPTAGVDTELRLTMWDFFKKINNDGVTIILTTHYLEEAERLCKNLSIIHHGEVVQNSPMVDIMSSSRKHTYIVRTDSKITDKNIFEENINIIDDKSCELTVDNKTSITEIITKFNQSNINVIDILSKRNKLRRTIYRANTKIMKDLYLIQITTIFKKEFARWSRIWIQTILPSVITMFLYITIFGNFIGERIGEIQWFRPIYTS
jgi:ABC-type methionine transport system ATPase subunit